MIMNLDCALFRWLSIYKVYKVCKLLPNHSHRGVSEAVTTAEYHRGARRRGCEVGMGLQWPGKSVTCCVLRNI